MTEPKSWGTYKKIFGALDKKIKEDPEAFKELEKNPYILLQRKSAAKVYTIPSIRQDFITKMKILIKEYEAELDYSHWCDEANPVIIIKDGYTISLDDLFSEED